MKRVGKLPIPQGAVEVFEVFHIGRGSTWHRRQVLGVYLDQNGAKASASALGGQVGRRAAMQVGDQFYMLASLNPIHVSTYSLDINHEQPRQV